MRGLVFLCLCLLAQVACTQSKGVFQVLHADSAFRQNVSLKPLDTLRQEDTIRSSGLLILVHQTGEFISIEGDTLIDVRALDSLLLAEKGMVKCANEFPVLGQLFETTSFMYLRLVSRVKTIEFIVPQANTGFSYFPNQQAAFMWKDMYNAIDTFKMEFVNLTDDTLISELTVHPYLEIDMNQFDADEMFILFYVSDFKDGYEKVITSFLPDSTAYLMPDSFVATTAIEALEIAFYLDTKNGYEESNAYYKLACELSPHPFYKTMLENQQKRGRDR